MLSKLNLIIMAAFLALTFGTRAQEPKSGQPYGAQVGGKQVTSQKRTPSRGIAPSRDELLKATRKSAPMNIIQADPTPQENPR
jgi:hypothetical protein